MKANSAWQILYVVNKRERVERSFGQMKGSVLRMVKQDRYKSLTENYISAAKEKLKIEIGDKKVVAIDLTRPGRPSPPADGGSSGGAAPMKSAPGDHGHDH